MKSAIRKIRRRRILATYLVWRRLRAMRAACPWAAHPYFSDHPAADMGVLLARLETRLAATAEIGRRQMKEQQR